MKQFISNTKIISGQGAVAYLAEIGCKRLLLVTDPFFFKNGIAEKIAKTAGAEQTEIFHRISPDPSVELVADGASVARSFKPDTIVALGGGSAIDCAKAMAYFSSEKIRLVVIPTTSGSGSEVTDFAILTHDQVKHPLIDARLRPEIAILDSELLSQLPASLVADTGFDVLSHALEAYVARDACAITDALAQHAFCIALTSLPASFAGRLQVRGKIHEASTMAGMAFTQAGLGLCHAMAHSLGGIFHLPHGRLNAILLPAVIACNAQAASEKYAELARHAGVGGSADTLAVRNLKNALIRLRREMKMPETLAQAGVEPGAVWNRAADIVKATLSDPCCNTNPLTVKDFMVREILEEVTGRV